MIRIRKFIITPTFLNFTDTISHRFILSLYIPKKHIYIMGSFDLKKRWKLFTTVFIIIILLFTTYRWFGPISRKTESVVYIDNNDTKDSIFNKISETAGRPSARGFSILATLTSYKIHPGRYAVEKGETMLNLYRKLRSGRQTPVKLVIPTVRTMDRLAGALDKKLMLDSVTLANAFADTTFCKKYGYDTATIACLFIPNTYEVYWNISLDDFMKRMIKENKAFWTPQRLAKAHEAGLTTNDVITLASIVDEETANNSEKPMVAGMYINRLNRDMPLQADPTIKFALKNFELKRIYHNLLDTDSPYNTYKNIGLPPGPIRIASIAGIDAVLNHQKHDYLYMCAKEDFSGTHNFARTYAEHLRNAEKYTEALNKRGIK